MTGQGQRLLDWRSGGWLLLLTLALVLGVVGWRVLPLLGSESRAVGDGSHVASYGFDLTDLRVPLRRVAAAGIPKDGIPALVDPRSMPGAAVSAFNQARRGKYLVSDDRVIGVALGGQSRAYPIRVLNWHEIVNDTLGGVAIAVTYHPLCDSVVVFRREVDGERLEFGVSGLLYNSNLLMYDRREEPRGESLWSQLLARAVSGPAAGRELIVLPASLARWEAWLARHPATTVIDPDPERLTRYGRDPYGNYLLTGRPRYPVDPLPPLGARRWMEPLVIVGRGAGAALCAPAANLADCDAVQRAGVVLDGDRTPWSAFADEAGETPVRYSAWFAWYAHHPPTTSRE